MSRDHNQALRDVLKGASVVYVGLIVEILVAFLAQWLAARYLSVSDFGGVTTGTALLNLGAIMTTLGLNEGFERYYPRLEPDEKRALTRVVYGVVIPLAVAVGLVISLNARFIAGSIFNDPTVAVSIRIFGAAIPFGALLELNTSGFKGQEESSYQVIIKNLLQPLSRFGLVALATLFGLAQAGFALAYAVPYAVAAAASGLLLLRSLPGIVRGSHPSLSRTVELSRELFSYSLPFTLASASGFLYRNADIFLLLYILDSDAVGVYGVAYAAARLILMFSTAMNFIGTPVASQLEKEAGVAEAINTYRPMIRWLFLLSVPALMPLVVFPTTFISEIYRPGYASGALALAVLAIGFAIHNGFSSLGVILRGHGKSLTLTINSALSALLNIGLNLLLIPRMGVLGAAIATTASYLLGDVLMVAELLYFTGETPLDWRQAPPLLVAAPLYAVTWFGSEYIPKTFLWLVAVTAVFGVVYWLLVVVIFKLEPEEVMLVRSVEEKYDVDLGIFGRFVKRFSKEDG